MSSKAADTSDKPPAEGKGGSGAPENKSAEKSDSDKKAPKPKTEPKYYVHSRRFLDAIVVVYALCVLGISRYFRPGFWSTIVYAVIGIPIGIGLSFIFYMRQRNRAKLRQLVRVLRRFATALQALHSQGFAAVIKSRTSPPGPRAS